MAMVKIFSSTDILLSGPSFIMFLNGNQQQRRFTLEETVRDSALIPELDEMQGDEDIAMVPIFINGNEALACITVREARRRGILALARTNEDAGLSRSELRDRMKMQFCQMLILEKLRERSAQ
jgi:hypothetical protein